MKLLISTLSLSLLSLFLPGGVASSEPTPTPWPAQFHSSLVINNSVGKLQINELWYDWPNRRNINIIHYQLKGILYDVEWDNGTSYYYTTKNCTTMHFLVGILRPNFLDGANYLGQMHKNGFLCNLWEKVDFIWYYEDVITNRPVSWTFYTGMTVQVMNFEVGKVLEEAEWQAPAYCFDEEENKAKAKANAKAKVEEDESAFGFSSLMRDINARLSLLVA